MQINFENKQVVKHGTKIKNNSGQVFTHAGNKSENINNINMNFSNLNIFSINRKIVKK